MQKFHEDHLKYWRLIQSILLVIPTAINFWKHWLNLSQIDGEMRNSNHQIVVHELIGGFLNISTNNNTPKDTSTQQPTRYLVSNSIYISRLPRRNAQLPEFNMQIHHSEWKLIP